MIVSTSGAVINRRFVGSPTWSTDSTLAKGLCSVEDPVAADGGQLRPTFTVGFRRQD